ncbi:capsule assembly Wzi family protein [Alkalilimnicola ehrlichii MLHE-1]|uniref:Capsule assembly Wzi family protein n=1 Tax=Alkalilimnicola ehrlichii (strain ATCC BAA-1101 / DSM 17681 / MLHE-1) TaxID=187272 RepID=Q0A649_ALKEH|nr:capsule assembly Wzi family protein [Alkalilimnicola ehrlichii]ABI57688.1 hypothetical protein Mlg_2348 [Alkalilimnicola ehrlichii MLHE-1]
MNTQKPPRQRVHRAPATHPPGRWWRRAALPLLLAGAGLTATASVQAHWLPENDARVRHDVQLLVDAGAITGALGTWPLPRQALAGVAARPQPPADLNPQQAAAWHRLHRQLARTEGWHGELRARGAAGEAEPPAQLAWYGHANPQGSQVDVAVGYQGDRLAARLSGQWVEDPADDKDFRADGSYLAAHLGNWIISAGAIDHYWGPGWSGSLILGNAARPSPGVAVQRAEPRASDLPVLNWLGPWTLQVFANRLESDRVVPRPYFIGGRFAFQPVQRLEVGLSRTAIWDSPHTWRSFGNIAIGDTNSKGRDTTADQMAGIDLRFSSPDHRLPWAAYLQYIGEDEAGGIPTKHIGLFGLETWGALPNDASYRVFLEYTDTTARFWSSRKRFATAYESSSLPTSYRYRDRPMGYATDNDSRLVTLGGQYLAPNGHSAHLKFQGGTLNRGDRMRMPGGGNRIAPRKLRLLDLEGEYRWPWLAGEVSLGAGIARLDPLDRGSVDWEPRGWAGYEWRF